MNLPAWSTLRSNALILRDVLCADAFIAALEDSLKSPDPLTAQAYAHDNGFRKIVLATGVADGVKLSLHHWADAAEQPGNIHNHRWDFTSLVAEGELSTCNWHPAPHGQLFSRYLYSSPAGSQVYRLVAHGSARVTSEEPVKRRVGSTYFLVHSVLHQAWAAPGTLTVIAQGPVEQLTTTVLSIDGSIPPDQPLTALTSEEVVDSLTSLVMSLKRLRRA
jgi:hypothetical protein